MSSPALISLTLADPPERWGALGFSVSGGAELALGGVRLVLGVDGKGVTSWSLEGLAHELEEIDGLPTTPAAEHAPRGLPPEEPAHPNGATGIDHVVIVTPDFQRTAAALDAAGMGLRRTREAPGGIRQGFRRVGPAIIELVQAPTAPAGPARFWGLVVIVSDLDALAGQLGPQVSTPKPAVQPGRQIATLRESAGLSTQVAFMTPEPDPRLTHLRSPI